MSQGTGVHLHTIYLVVGMSDILASILGVCLQVRLGKISLIRQNAIQGFYRMSLAQNEPVAVRILDLIRPHIHHMIIQRYQNIAYAVVSADMSRLSAVYHIQYILPDLVGFFFQVHHLTLLILPGDKP